MGGSDSLEFGPCDPETFHPDLDWLEERCNSQSPPRLVYLVNPANPTGDSCLHPYMSAGRAPRLVAFKQQHILSPNSTSALCGSCCLTVISSKHAIQTVCGADVAGVRHIASRGHKPTCSDALCIGSSQSIPSAGLKSFQTVRRCVAVGLMNITWFIPSF